ncbi:Rpp14/Pop5 family-domain-containing protein [Lactifluus volemus]|nr:Rpp14/Pop5 family-domain-containing protein [Lactifluus volemus]
MVRFKVPFLVPTFATIKTALTRALSEPLAPHRIHPCLCLRSKLCHITTPTLQDMSGKDVFAALKQSMLLHFGDTGWGEVGASLAVKYFSPMTHLCIVRVARGIAARTTWAAAALLDRVGGGEGCRVVPHVIHVSGTVSLRLCMRPLLYV